MRSVGKHSIVSFVFVFALASCGGNDPVTPDAMVGPDAMVDPDAMVFPDAMVDAAPPPTEICDNAIDDDNDGDVDCGDADCVTQPVCTAGCGTITVATDPSTVSGDTAVEPNNADGSCQGSPLGQNTGPDVLYEITAANTGRMTLTLTSGADLGLHVRATCGDAMTEAKCADNTLGSGTEVITMHVTVGQVIFVYVDGFGPGDEGAFLLDIASMVLPPETACSNIIDDDEDGLTDCEDPDCVTTGVCTVGMTPTGDACDDNSDCTADGGDPLCISEINYGWPGGFCSEYCDNMTGIGCGSPNTVCVPFAAMTGVCWRTCMTVADCNIGYMCLDVGFGPTCLPNCTANSQCPSTMFCDTSVGTCRFPENCTNGVDDPGSTVDRVDCEDPDCYADAACPLAGLCSAATPIVGVTSGSTSAGSAAFAASCVGNNLAKESIHSFTPGVAGETGTLTITLTTTANMGLYARSTCAVEASQLGCANDLAPGNETLVLSGVAGGVPVTVFVDGDGPTDAGMYTISAVFVAM